MDDVSVSRFDGDAGVQNYPGISRLVSGLIPVVIERFDDGDWVAYFCTDA